MDKEQQAQIALAEEQARAITAFNAGVGETNRRERGNFDELLGQFPKKSSQLLRAIVSTLRDYLLDRYSDDDARRLLRELEPVAGYGNGIILPADVVLAGTLFNSIRGAARCNGERFDELVWGARDAKRQAGAREGGKAAGKKLADESAATHQIWRKDANKLIAAGKDPRNVAEILSRRHGVDKSTIRRGLKRTRTNNEDAV